MTGRREQRRQQTRARVVQAAKDLLPERGVDGTTAVELAAAADISRATFFNYFASKQELLTALWEEQVGNLAEEVSARLAEPLTTEARVRLLFADLLAALERRPGYLAAVATELERGSDPDTLRQRRDLFQAQLRRIVDAGLAQGDVRTDCEPALLCDMIGAVYQSVLRDLRLEGEDDARRRVPDAGAFIAGAVSR